MSLLEPKTHVVSFQGHDLVYRSYFSEKPGTPIVLVHGLISSIDFFSDRNLRELGEFGPVYTLSLPGHPPSRWPSPFPKTDASLFANTLAAQILNFAQGRKVVLLGHSTGAQAALSLALARPELVNRLIVCEGAPEGRETNGMFRILQRLVISYGIVGSAIFKMIFKLNSFALWTNRWFMRELFSHPDSLKRCADLIEAQTKFFPALKELDLNIMKQMFCDLDELDLKPQLKRLKVPLLVLVGDQDAYVSVTAARQIASLAPAADLAVLKEGGHVPFFEHPEWLLQQVRQFLSSRSAIRSND